LIAFNEQHRDREMPFFGQELFLQAAAKGPLTDKAYMDALAKDRKLSRDEGIDATLAKDKLDAIVAPTGGLPWLIDWVNGRRVSTGSSSTPAAVAGYPSVTVPAGYAFGLPSDFVPRNGVERSDAPEIRLRLRARDERPEAAAVPSPRRSREPNPDASGLGGARHAAPCA